MGTFKTAKTLIGAAPYISEIASRIQETFQAEGYEVINESLLSGSCDISITKGGIFKAVLGMKTALKVSIVPNGNDANFEAGIGIFGQQAIPTVISMLFFWPVLITQIWGMVQQSQLDDKALAIAEQVLATHTGNTNTTATTNREQGADKFCTECGFRITVPAKFCPNCGKAL